jgi:hypothetical protein
MTIFINTILIQLITLLFLFVNHTNNYIIKEIDEDLFSEYYILEIEECKSSKLFILITSKNNKFIGDSFEKINENNIYQFKLEKIDYPLLSKINLESDKRNRRPSIRSCGNFIYKISGKNEEVLLKWENDTISGEIYFDKEIKGIYVKKDRKIEKCP